MATDDEQDQAEAQQWDDLELVRDLRAPGTPDELAAEADFVAAYRAQQPHGSVRRIVGRFGIGATSAVTVVALSAGVAAAYGRVLPDPVQNFVHGVLGNVGVPAPEHHRISARPPKVPSSAPVTVAPPPPGPTVRATPGVPPAGVPTPTTGVSGTPTPVPTPSTTTSPVPVRVPAAVTATTPSSKVVVGSTATVSGVVTASDGTDLRNRSVALMARSAGHSWAMVASGRTDRQGRIVLQTPALSQTTDLRLRTTHHVRSAVVRVVVLPVLQSIVATASGTSTITVTAQGGRPGETVSIFRPKDGVLVRVASGQLDANGSVVFSLPTPKRAVRFFVRLPANRYHGQAQTSLVVGG